MKLKEKLARDYSGPERFIADTEINNQYEAYLAGFEMARYMAMRRLDNTDWVRTANDVGSMGEEESNE